MMNNIFLVLVLISCAAVMRGTGHAAPPTASPHQASGATSANTASNNSGDLVQTSAGDATKTNHPHQLSGKADRSTLRNAKNLHQPGSATPVFIAKGVSIQNQGARPAFSVRHGVLRSNAPSPIVVRHRFSNPAFVGGPENTNARSAGAIDGTRMNRKP